VSLRGVVLGVVFRMVFRMVLVMVLVVLLGMLFWEELWTANTVKPAIAYSQEWSQRPAMSD